MKKIFLVMIALTLIILTVGAVSAGGLDDSKGYGSNYLSSSYDDEVILDSSEDGIMLESSNEDKILESNDVMALESSNEDKILESKENVLGEGEDNSSSEDLEPKTYIEINGYDYMNDAQPHSVNIEDDTDYVAKIYTTAEAEGNVTVYIGKDNDDLSEIGFIEDIRSLDYEVDENHTGFSTFYIRPGDLEDIIPDWYFVSVVYRYGLSLNETEVAFVRFVEDSDHVIVDAPPEIIIGDWDNSYITVFVEGNLGRLRVLVDGELVFEDLVDNLVYDEVEETYNFFIPVYMGDLSIGVHNYSVSYYDGNWDNVSIEDTIDVTYLFDLIYDDEIDYGEDAEIQIILPFDAIGNQIMVNGNAYDIDLEDGLASITLSGLEIGENDFEFTYNDAIYGEKTITASLTVNPNLVLPDIVSDLNDNQITFNLPSDAEGTLNIYVYNGSEAVLKDSVNLVNGEAVYSFENWAFGSYDVLVEYDDGTYTVSNESIIRILPKVDLSNETALSQDAALSVDIPDVSGTIVVNLNGEEYALKEIVGGNVKLNIPADKLHLGENIVTLKYEGDDLNDPFTYEEDGENVTMEYVIVVKPTELIIPDGFASNDTGNISIELPEGTSGNLTVYLGDEIVSTSPVSSGTNDIPLFGLQAGENEIKVVFTDENGFEYAVDKNVTLTNPGASFNTTVPTDNEIPEFSISLPSDATGSLIVHINGKEYVRDLVNGKANISVSDLEDGTYDVIIRYTGDEKYGGYTNKTNVTIKKAVPVVLKDPSLIIKVPSIYKGKKAVVTVTTDAAFSGKVTVKINSKTYTVNVVKGKGNVSVSGLAVGTYKATASFAANNVFKASTKSVNFKVKANVVRLALQKVKVKRSANRVVIKAVLKVNGKLISGKALAFKFIKKAYKAKTNKKGVAAIVISKTILKKLKAGKKIAYQVSFGKKTVKRVVTVLR